MLQHVIRHASDSDVRYNLVLKILETATNRREDMQADFILQENIDKTNALHVAIEKDDLDVLILISQHLPKDCDKYSPLNRGA